jgi:dienelactone hydrolase
MKSFARNTLYALLAGLMLAGALHQYVHAQSTAVQTLPATQAASAARGAQYVEAADPQVQGRWAGNVKALAIALGDEAVVPHFSTQDLDWMDESRKRPVPVRLYLPDAASASTRVPLVVFSHGLGGSRMGYSYLGQYFAQNGIASLHVQHVGSDRALWMGNVLTMASRLKDATTDQEAIARALDVRFALNTVLADPQWGPRLDADKIMAAGHSFGANTTLLVAGAQVAQDGKPLDLRDGRIRAALVLSSPPFYNAAQASEALGHMAIPSLHITAVEDVIRVPGYFSSAEDRVNVYRAYQGAPKGLVVFKDGSHSMFTDRLNTGGEVLNPRVKRATREVALAFAQSVFNGKVQTEYPDWARQHADILEQVTAGEAAPISTAGRLAAKP